MGAKKFSHTHRSTMCGLKKLASGFFQGSWKMLAERRRQRRRQRRRRRKRTKNNKSPLYPGWLKYHVILGSPLRNCYINSCFNLECNSKQRHFQRRGHSYLIKVSWLLLNVLRHDWRNIDVTGTYRGITYKLHYKRYQIYPRNAVQGQYNHDILSGSCRQFLMLVWGCFNGTFPFWFINSSCNQVHRLRPNRWVSGRKT